jgi:two-component system, LytTR family, response regulator
VLDLTVEALALFDKGGGRKNDFGSRIQVVRTQDIDWIAAAGDYVEFHSNGRSHLLHETMNSVRQKLDP